MVIGSGEGQLIPVLLAVFGVIQFGIISSTIGLVFHLVTRWLSRCTHIGEPDPTMYTRQFEMLFDTLFAPVGWTVANKTQSPMVSQLSFQISIGVTVILSALLTYLVTGGILTGTVVATHHAFGFVINPMPLFRTVVAFVVVWALAVVSHAGDRAKQIPA